MDIFSNYVYNSSSIKQDYKFETVTYTTHLVYRPSLTATSKIIVTEILVISGLQNILSGQIGWQKKKP